MKKTLTFIKEFPKKHLAWTLVILACVFFSIQNPYFLQVKNFFNILNQYAYVFIAAFGICFIQMSGNMDMSIGFGISICCVVLAYMLRAGIPIVICIIATIALSIVLCLFTTFWSLLLRLPRMFISFASMSIFQGAAFLLSQGKTINGFPDAFKVIGQGLIPGTNATWSLLLVLVFGLLVSFVLNKTYFGRHVFAIGGNPSAARLAGIDVDKTTIIIGVIGGFFLGLSAILLTSRVGSANAQLAAGTETTVITGLLVGGVSVRGGEGKLNGCFAGILLIALLINGMQLAGINTYWQFVLRGLIMLVTVWIDYINFNKESAALNTKKGKVNAEKLALETKA